MLYFYVSRQSSHQKVCFDSSLPTEGMDLFLLLFPCSFNYSYCHYHREQGFLFKHFLFYLTFPSHHFSYWIEFSNWFPLEVLEFTLLSWWLEILHHVLLQLFEFIVVIFFVKYFGSVRLILFQYHSTRSNDKKLSLFINSAMSMLGVGTQMRLKKSTRCRWVKLILLPSLFMVNDKTSLTFFS